MRCCSLRACALTKLANHHRVSEEGNMGRILAALLVAASLLSMASSEASAWVCRAAGLGSGGLGRSYSLIDAKLLARRRREHYSPLPVCTILWGRPRGRGVRA